MSSLPSELLKLVDRKTEYVVNGFIHRIENISSLSINVPRSIIQICILFFFQFEYFEKCGDDLSITGDQENRIKKSAEVDGWRNIGYGSKWIESNTSNIIRWTIKIIKHKQNDGVMVGVISKEIDSNDCLWNSTHCTFLWNKIIYYEGCNINDEYIDHYWVNTNVLLTMELNLKKSELIYYINDKCYGTATNKIKKSDNIRYKLAVSLYWPYDEIEIVKYECN